MSKNDDKEKDKDKENNSLGTIAEDKKIDNTPSKEEEEKKKIPF